MILIYLEKISRYLHITIINEEDRVHKHKQHFNNWLAQAIAAKNLSNYYQIWHTVIKQIFTYSKWFAFIEIQYLQLIYTLVIA